MGYHIDLESYSIDDYKHLLKSTHLIPSWKILLDNIDENTEAIKKQGVKNLGALLKALKDKDLLQKFSRQSGIPEPYLVVLRRMVKGYLTKPRRIKDFPETSETVINKLGKVGIKNTRHLFDRIKTVKSRAQLSKETGVNEKDLVRLAKLTDLSRIRWVNHTFAYVLYEAGFDTVAKMTRTDPEVLYEKVKKLNAERNVYSAHIGLNDMKMLVESAKMISLDMELNHMGQ